MKFHARSKLALPVYRMLLAMLPLCWLTPVSAIRADMVADQIASWGFPVGEELVYRVYWGAIPVGEATVFAAWQDEAEGEYIVLRLQVRSTRAIAMLYPVSIDVESVVRAEDFLPVRHSQNRREGHRRAQEEMVFDHDRGTATWRSLLRDREKLIELEPDTRDILSLMYYLRRYSMKPDSRTHHRVLTDEKIYDLWLQVAEKEIPVSSILEADVAAIAVEPEAAFDGVFRRQGRLELLVSRDARQLLLAMRAHIPIGSIRTVLTEVRGPGADIWGQLVSDAE